MEKQSNSDTELVKQERTSTSLDGQSQSQVIPFRNLAYEEDGLRLYFIDVAGQLSFHVDNDLPIDAARLKHLHEVFDCLVATMQIKGWNHIDTWIPPEMGPEIKFAESFGFQPTGKLKVVTYTNGLEQEFVEMRINF